MGLGNSRPAFRRSVLDASHYGCHCSNVCVRGTSCVKLHHKLLFQFYRSVVERMYSWLKQQYKDIENNSIIHCSNIATIQPSGAEFPTTKMQFKLKVRLELAVQIILGSMSAQFEHRLSG